MDAKEFLAQFNEDLEKMKTEVGDMVGAFAGLFSKTMVQGALTAKHKELIALGIAVAKQCEPCITLHVKKSLDAGASKDEMLEACCVAVMMSGGPAYTHIPIAIKAIEQLTN
ncbi:MAG: carboxymuconolactone decarboxylase family protein [Phycisphaerae bacterium]|nr:carboxymuconolactone decarboxylase family protein [Phycisphaerae bacterium]